MTEGKVLSVASTKPMDPRAAAEFLGLDVKTITRWARQGYVPAHPLGEGKRKFWRFFESELIEWLAAKTNRSAVL
jgi:predicted site-specific integrase-resolvase